MGEIENYFNMIRSTFIPTMSKTSLLKYPYSTDCIDYQNPTSIKGSYLNCMINDHRLTFGKIPYDLTVPSYFTDSRMKSNKTIKKLCLQKSFQKSNCHYIKYRFELKPRRSFHGDIFCQISR